MVLGRREAKMKCRLEKSVGLLLMVLLLGFGDVVSALAVENIETFPPEDNSATTGEQLALASPASAVVFATKAGEAAESADMAELDPWEPFNESMFSFNRELDRYVLKPVATAWDTIFPDPVQRSISNAIDNLDVVRRLTNNLLQLKFAGAGREIARFGINSTIGIVGLFDVAKDGFGIERSDEDTGQTFGVWGAGPGPYLVLPFLPVMTVRDGVGRVFDTAMNPMVWLAPAGVTLGINGTYIVNERSLNLDKFQSVEEAVVDLYGAVRNAYLQRREAAIRE
jgi:phospholipid-binding lipoprotein MlaA